MKSRLFFPLTLGLLIPSCSPFDGRGGDPPAGPMAHTGLPPGHQPYQGPDRATYELGMGQGRSDASGGKSRQPSRHYGTFPATQTSAFNRGYQAGYSLTTQGGGGGIGPVTAPLTPVKEPGRVTLRRDGQAVAVCRTAMAEVESVRFITGQRQIVVKSRTGRGPAAVQLFDTATGAEEARVMASQIRGGRPAWAAGMGE